MPTHLVMSPERVLTDDLETAPDSRWEKHNNHAGENVREPDSPAENYHEQIYMKSGSEKSSSGKKRTGKDCEKSEGGVSTDNQPANASGFFEIGIKIKAKRSYHQRGAPSIPIDLLQVAGGRARSGASTGFALGIRIGIVKKKMAHPNTKMQGGLETTKRSAKSGKRIKASEDRRQTAHYPCGVEGRETQNRIGKRKRDGQGNGEGTEASRGGITSNWHVIRRESWDP